MKKNIILLILFFLLLSSLSSAQSILEPLHNDVYGFLGRLSSKGLIEINDLIKPLNRKYIAEKLSEVNRQRLNLTSLEKDELDFYLKEFGKELNLLGIEDSSYTLRSNTIDLREVGKPVGNYSNWFGKDKYGRIRLFNYESELFSVNVSPILGFKVGRIDTSNFTHRWNGISLFGYLTDFIGYSFSFRDNRESGDQLDWEKKFSSTTGIVKSIQDENGFEYSEVRTTIGTEWSWGSFSIGKDFLEWGYAKSGKLVLSDKAPSFPFIRLDLHPTGWLQFNYIHAWLSSNIIDSSEVYNTTLRSSQRLLYRDKYISSHTLTLNLSGGQTDRNPNLLNHTLTLSLGESIIYSDRFEISYLMPLMFFRLADHYLSNANNNAGDNSQFFFNISSRNHIPNTHIYGTLFIDEIALTNIFKGDKNRNQVGFTLGLSIVDLPFDNLTLTAEYTRIQPFVYRHYIQTQTYASYHYVLGHWMGHNSDLFYASFNYRIMRGLQLEIWSQWIRKGEDGEVQDQYSYPTKPFLFGLNTKYFYCGIDIKYEIIHEAFIRLNFESQKTSREQLDGSFIDSRLNQFYFAVYYGL